MPMLASVLLASQVAGVVPAPRADDVRPRPPALQECVTVQVGLPAGRRAVSRRPAFSARQVLRDIDIYDTTGIIFDFASGAIGYLGTGFVVANRTNILAVHGTEGQAFAEGEASRLTLRKKGESQASQVAVQAVDWIAEQLAEFGRCVREGGRPEVGGDEGTANVAVLEAIIESTKPEERCSSNASPDYSRKIRE